MSAEIRRTGSIVRLVLVAIVAIALAALAAMQTASSVMQRTSPVVAQKLAPWDGSSRAYLAMRLYTAAMAQAAQAGSSEVPGVEPLAEESLKAYQRDPLTPGALAIIASSLPAEEQALLWPEIDRLSRRDTVSQTLLLQDAANRRDLDAMIVKLNQILLVRPSRGPAIYGLMSQAVRDPLSVPALTKMLQDDPPWGEAFLQTAAGDAEALDNLVTIRAALPDASVEADTDTKLIGALANAGKFSSAYTLYRKLEASMPQDAGPWKNELPPFDWNLQSGLNFKAEAVDDGKQLEFEIGRGKGGDFASRIVPASGSSISVRGTYNLKTTGRNAPLTANVTCGGSEAPLASSEFADGQIALDAALPASGCDFVRVALSGRAWSDGEPITGQVSDLAIAFR